MSRAKPLAATADHWGSRNEIKGLTVDEDRVSWGTVRVDYALGDSKDVVWLPCRDEGEEGGEEGKGECPRQHHCLLLSPLAVVLVGVYRFVSINYRRRREGKG